MSEVHQYTTYSSFIKKEHLCYSTKDPDAARWNITWNIARNIDGASGK